MGNGDLALIGTLLRRHRERQGVTQEELAERAGSGFSVDTISKIERGRNRPRQHTLQELMGALRLNETERAEVLRAWRDAAGPRTESMERPAAHGIQEPPVGGYLGALPANELVGRQREARWALSLLNAAERGSGRLVLLAGEAGIGKTRLAQEVGAEAWRRDFLVAAGRCYEPQETIPYYPFLEALATLYEVAPAEISGVTGQRWPYLATLLPERLQSQEGHSLNSAEEKLRLIRAVVGFVGAVAQVVPVAIMLDDLHWSDSASLDLLVHLVRQTRGQRVFLLGTYRDVEVDRRHPLQAVLRDLMREQLVERIGLELLGRDVTAALIGSITRQPVSEELIEVVHSHTEGNPFFVQQVVHALLERGEADQIRPVRPGHPIEVPENVRLVIHQRLSRLPEETQSMLYEASVLGQTFRFDELRKMGAYEEMGLEQGLQEAGGTGLLRELGNDLYAFDHALTQQALYGELSGRRRRRLHRAAGEALEQMPLLESRAAQVAWHFLQSDDVERALPHTLLAGDQAERVFAHTEAERHYRNALELAKVIGDSQREVEALEKLGSLLSTVGRYDEALGTLEQAAMMCRAARDSEGTARVVARIGLLHLTQATYDAGIARIQSLLETVTGGGEGLRATPAQVSLRVVLSSLFLERSSYTEALCAGEEAVVVAQMVGDSGLLAQAEGRRGLALLLLGRREEARKVLEAVVPLAEAAYDLDTLNRALLNIALSYLWAGKYQVGRPFLERALALAERMGDPVRVANLGRLLARFAFSAGEWAQARSDLLRTIDAVRRLDSSWAEARPLLGLGKIALAEGKWEEATGKLEKAAALAERAGDLVLLREVQLAFAELELRQGSAEIVIARLQPYLDGPNAGPYSVIPEILILLTEAHLVMGDVGAAEQLAAQAVERAHPLGVPWVHSANRLRAAVIALQERWEEAERAFVEALAAARADHAVYEEALLLYEYGAMQVRRGERKQARERWEEALTIFQRLGAGLYADRTRQALAKRSGAFDGLITVRPTVPQMGGGR